jgi:hypothetical protein
LKEEGDEGSHFLFFLSKTGFRKLLSIWIEEVAGKVVCSPLYL